MRKNRESHFERMKCYNKFAISSSQLVAPPAVRQITIGATIFSVARYAVAICVVCRNAKRKDTIFLDRNFSLDVFLYGQLTFGTRNRTAVAREIYL